MIPDRQQGFDLLERLAARHRAAGQGTPFDGVSRMVLPAGDPERFFLTQVRHPRYNPDAPSATANCGPASLAMALLALHRVPAGVNRQALVMQVRQVMTGRQDAHELTSEEDIRRGAEATGLKARYVESLQAVDSALQSGELVVLAGNPAAYNQGMSRDQIVPFDGGHFVLVAGMQGGRFVICDPYSMVGPLTVSREQLADFMAHRQWNIGVALKP
jgi:ABC-type bacteriocin/lantibiotic exporter with double-glycine peptidase domain